MIYIPEPLDVHDYRTLEPIDAAKIMVNIGWSLMAPDSESETNYDMAYAMNMAGYMAGHPEGASNIGWLIAHEVLSDELLELAMVGHDTIDVAEAWYLKALESPFHSPQAEIELAIITAINPYKSYTSETRALFESYINRAIENAMNPDSIWADEREKYLLEIEETKERMNELLAKKEPKLTTVH